MNKYKSPRHFPPSLLLLALAVVPDFSCSERQSLEWNGESWVPSMLDAGGATPDAGNPTGEVGLSCAAAGLRMCGGACVDVQSNSRNCGACGTSCPTGQFCREGQCATSCDAPRSVCLGSGVLACVDRSTDPVNCGTCGTVCSRGPSSAPFCMGGICGIQCEAARGNCDGDFRNGCETDLGSSLQNCGACGQACAMRPNAISTCVASACQSACSAGFADCNRTPADGCEVNLQASASNCSACGIECAIGANCVGGRCSCPENMTPCGGRCVDLRSDSGNCAACGAACGSGNWCVDRACQALPNRYRRSTVPAGVVFLDVCAQPDHRVLLSNADDRSEDVTLPFAFRYWNVQFAAGVQMHVTSNGWIAFPPARNASLGGDIPSTNEPNGVIAAYWRDNLNRTPGQCIATLGSAPYRRWVMEVLHGQHCGTECFREADDTTYEIVLYETTNVIDFLYREMSGANGSVVGLENPIGTEGVSGCTTAGTYRCVPTTNSSIRFSPSP